MTFATDLAALPFRATQPDAKGFVPPLLRLSSHLVFATAGSFKPELVSTDEVLTELREAAAFSNAIHTDTEALSTAAKNHVAGLRNLLASAITEYAGWDERARTDNLREILNRAIYTGVLLDRELVGLTDSDAGHKL